MTRSRIRRHRASPATTETSFAFDLSASTSSTFSTHTAGAFPSQHHSELISLTHSVSTSHCPSCPIPTSNKRSLGSHLKPPLSDQRFIGTSPLHPYYNTSHPPHFTRRDLPIFSGNMTGTITPIRPSVDNSYFSPRSPTPAKRLRSCLSPTRTPIGSNTPSRVHGSRAASFSSECSGMTDGRRGSKSVRWEENEECGAVTVSA